MTDDLPDWMQYSLESQLEEPIDTKLTGEVPKWLTGTLYRNGSGMFKIGETTVNHLFDGMCVLHKFVIKDGKVTYQNKLLNSASLEKCLKANRVVVTMFGTASMPDPCKNIFQRFFSYFIPEEMTDNTAVNIVPHGDMLLAMTETSKINVVDPETLKRKDTISLDKLLAVHTATAHPHTDEEGNMYNLATCFDPQKAHNIIKIPPLEKGEDNSFKRASLVSTFPSRWKINFSYNHSFGMSPNYFIILEQTLAINCLKLPFMKVLGKGFEYCMANYPNEKSGRTSLDYNPWCGQPFTAIDEETIEAVEKCILADRRAVINIAKRSDGTRSKTRYIADAFFCFHFINCYEEDDHVVIDLCAFDTGDVIKDLYMEDIKDKNLGKYYAKVRRYVLPLNIEDSQVKNENLVTLSGTSATAVRQADGTVFCTPDYIIGDSSEGVSLELPRINYSYNTKKYRYVYGCGLMTDKPYVTKLDVLAKTVQQWKPEGNDQSGEPIFIPRPGGTDEDDGVILAPVIPMNRGRNAYLIILDAKTFKEIARGVVPSDVKVPLSFHGSFIPSTL